MKYITGRSRTIRYGFRRFRYLQFAILAIQELNFAELRTLIELKFNALVNEWCNSEFLKIFYRKFYITSYGLLTRTIFDNVCTCTVGALILLPVTNLSSKMDSATPISYETRTSSLHTNVFVFTLFYIHRCKCIWRNPFFLWVRLCDS